MSAIRSLEVPRTGTILVTGLMLTVMSTLALTSLHHTTTPVPAIIGVAILIVVGSRTALDGHPRLPRDIAILASATPTALALIVPWPVIRDGYALWHLGAGALLLLLVAIRGRLGLAWAGMAGMSAATLVWAVVSDFNFTVAVVSLVRQIGLLLIGTVFVVAVSRVQRQLADLAEEGSRLAAAEAAEQAAEQERRGRLRWAQELAAPILHEIASLESVAPETRVEASLVEAELRDGLRARTLAAEPVTGEARAARQRGVEVTLLDDLGRDLPEELAARLRERVARELRQTSDGRIVVRLPPAERAPLVTILVEGPDARRLELDPDTLA